MFKNQEFYNGHQQLFKQIIIFFWQFEQETFSQLLSSRYFFELFFFLSVNQKDSNALTSHCNRLNNIIKNLLVNQDTILIIIDTSIKNNIVTLVSHIYRGQEVITKSVYYAMNVTSMEAELFSIRYRINHAVQLQDIICIIVITNAITAAKWIFDLSVHPYQLHSIVISKNLRYFFKKNLK